MTALLLIPYFIAGLYVSRWWWRLDEHQDSDAAIFTYAICVAWPLYLAGTAIFMFVRWFYNQPPRKRS